MTTISIQASELRAGDLLDYRGRFHRITDVVRGAGWTFPVATDGTGWGIALGEGRLSVCRG